MRVLRPIVPGLFVVLALFAAIVASSAACTGNQRRDTLKTTYAAVNAASDGFVTWDREHQAAIVDAATSREQGAAALATYRDKRSVIASGLELAYKALALAALDLKDDHAYESAMKKSTDLLDAISAFKKVAGPDVHPQ